MSIERGNSDSYIREKAEKRSRWLLLILAIPLVLSLPLFLGSYFTYLFNLIGIYVIIAVGLNILTGYAGQISLGHAALVAFGAYSSALLVTRLHIPFLVAIPTAGLISSLAGLVVAIPALRLRGFYLAIATMAFSFIIAEMIIALRFLSGGVGGMTVPKPSVWGRRIALDRDFSYLLYPIVIVLCMTAKSICDHSRIGRAFIAIRDSEPVAEAFGVSLTKYKILAFLVSSFYAGVAGSLFAHYLGFIGPDNFTLMDSVRYIVMLVVGGMESVAGSIMGAVFISVLPEAIRVAKDYLPRFVQQEKELHLAVYALIMLGFMIFEPKGLYGRWLRVKFYMKRFPFNKKRAHMFKRREIRYSSVIEK